MNKEHFILELTQRSASYLILLSIAGIGLAAVVLIYTGALGWILALVGKVVRASIWHGFHVWERLFAWATLPWFLGVILGLLAVGAFAAARLPSLTVLCALIPMFMGLTACLAYMFLDRERYEVDRGHKALHNPLKGQGLALYLARYGQQAGIPLLVVAAVGMIGGFALLNQGLYETIGRGWYAVGEDLDEPASVDFLAYALVHLLSIVDLLNVARSNQLLQITHVRPATWQASILLASFRAFFTFILLQQIYASVRQGNLLAETITDFWSPHESIHQRARNALPQYGARAIVPLLRGLQSARSLTKEQRDQLPPILAALGPAAIPVLVRHLHDTDEQIRAIAVGALGYLHTRDEVHLLVELAQDPSDMVKQNLVATLGRIAASSGDTDPAKRRRRRPLAFPLLWIQGWLPWKSRAAPISPPDPIAVAVLTLRNALKDESVTVRIHAARALGQVGLSSAEVVVDLIALLQDAAETVRCEVADALGKVGGNQESAVAALIAVLSDVSPLVRTSAALALGALKLAAAPAVSALVPLLQDSEPSVRAAAAEAIAKAGSLTDAGTESLVNGLSSEDNVVRAQTAEALGKIGAPAQEAVPALVEALADSNDRVRAEAVQALGRIGEGAADAAVPSLLHALKDQDNWVSALAAEALGQMGDSADEAVPALIRSLQHMNTQVRRNAAESLGKMGPGAAKARPFLEKACLDEDGGVRSQAIRALGALGPTAASRQKAILGLQDADPQVRTAAVEAIGQWGETDEAVLSRLLPLLEDTNDQVKVRVAEVLPRLAGAAPAVIEGLCRRLLEDESVLVQFEAAQALSKLGPAAVAAGAPLLRAAQTAEVTVREQAMRAIAMIQPPEAAAAFASGLTDADGEIRKMASAGWMKASAIPEDVIPGLVEALRDPEVQVRANAAHALARLDSLPESAVPLLIACTADSNDGLRINAANALKQATGGEVREAMEHLVEDANLRIRLIAASFLLSIDPIHAQAIVVVTETLNDPTVRLRQAALALVKSLNAGAVAFLDALRLRVTLEEEPDLRAALLELVEQAGAQTSGELQVLA